MSEHGDPASLDPAAAASLAFEVALETRAPQLHAATPLVAELAKAVGTLLGYDPAALLDLDRAARLRDIGMLELPDAVLESIGPLAPEAWDAIRRHPGTGARMLERVPALAGLSDAVHFHHERFDGKGYPEGIGGAEIPLASRVIAACDTFAAMAINRPHRPALGYPAAAEQILDGRGSQFDPDVVDGLLSSLEGPVGDPTPGPAESEPRGTTDSDTGARARSREQRGNIALAVDELETIPALAPARERLLTLLDTPGTTAGEIAAAVEDDVGLAAAVLRLAQGDGRDGDVKSVSLAVQALGPERIRAEVEGLPVSRFWWSGSPWERMLQRFRVHAIAVGRAATKLARDADRREADDLRAAALLHDVGKLVLVRARPDYPGKLLAGARTPEEALRREQRAFGMDHAMLGALLLRRWRLPDALATLVHDHHADDAGADAGLLRLADMLVHHAHGGEVDRGAMLRVGYACGLHPQALRAALFELPHSAGSERRRVEPSPLSARETEIVRRLADGKRYAQIAEDLDLAVSTVRSHLHNAYAKLGSADRAQAVLRATEQGWL